MTAAKPGHLEALDNLVRDTLGRVRTFKAANVVAYVPPSPSSRATVTVQLARKQADLEGRTSEIPPIPDVPVMWPGFGDFMIWGTLKPGDDVILGVPDRSIKAWLQRGRTVDPDAGPLFNVANAVAWPVRLSRAKGAIPAGGLFLGRTDGTALIKILEDGTAVLVDASASIVLGTPGQALPLVQAAGLATAVAAAASAAVTAAGGVITPDSGAAAFGAFAASMAGASYATTKVAGE